MKRKYQGSCHCGLVRFECELDLSAGTSKCNCSICSKSRFWKAIVKADAFRLLQGPEALTDCQFGRTMIHHLFCRRCGVKPFGRGRLDELEFYAINVACLDDVSPDELANAPVSYQDGRNARWEAAQAEMRHL